ncbi:manganese efflux pump MntP family protein [Clostridium paraputrificum]|uniref:manganese efflux pump MntP n=1 Tax=Clostridium TaxID=1485 RepID=UPI003D34F939
MNIISIFLIGLGLSMDAFAVALTIGMNTKKADKFKMALKSAFYFGGFQGLMPFIGWALGIRFSDYIQKVDHWIAFILLSIVGGKMLIEAIKCGGDDEEEKECCNKRFVILAIATSIDALAVGVSFAFLNVNIVSSVLVIGITTFILSIIAVYIGDVLGKLFRTKAEILGGAILIIIGIKILIEHLFNV